MKRSVSEILRRGLDSMVANWPLIAVRVASGIVLMVLIVGAIVAAIVPLAVSIGIRGVPKTAPDPQWVVDVLLKHWPALLIALVVLSVVLLVAVLLYAFLEAGCAAVYVDAERGAPRSAARPALAKFSMDRWMAAARASGMTVFWLLNIAWTIAGVVLLIPLCLTLVAILAMGQSTGAIAAGCGGLALSLLIMMPVGFFTGVLTRKATVVAVDRGLGASAALKVAWRGMMADFARHFAVGFVLVAISFGVAALVGVMSFVGSSRSNPSAALFVFMPLQVVASFANSIVSAAVAGWFTASMAALTVEEPR